MLGRLKFEIDELINEMLNALPSSTWINPEITFCDLAMGGGQFLKSIIARLRMAGHSDSNIAARIFGFESNKLKIAFAINKHNLIGTFKCTDIFKEETKMKFDVIVGNPPYADSNGAKNKKLWRIFSEKALSLNPQFLGFVTPNNIVSDKGTNGNQLRAAIASSGYGFLLAANHDERMFDAGVETCHWIIERDTQDKVNPIILHQAITNHPGQSILDKINNSNDDRFNLVMNNGWVSKKSLSSTGANEIHFSGPKMVKTDEILENTNSLKLVFPFSTSYHKQFITNNAVGMLNLFCPISSVEEGKRIMSFTLSKAFVYFAENFKKTSGFCPAVKNNRIPKLDSSIMWTDADVYSHFNFTEDEIRIIESNQKR